MQLDLAGGLAEALTDSRVSSAMSKLVESAVSAALSKSAADSWLSAAEAARYVYGCDGKTEAFRKLRNANPELDAMGVGTGRLRRWKRTDLDAWIASSPRAQRRRNKE